MIQRLFHLLTALSAVVVIAIYDLNAVAISQDMRLALYCLCGYGATSLITGHLSQRIEAIKTTRALRDPSAESMIREMDPRTLKALRRALKDQAL